MNSLTYDSFTSIYFYRASRIVSRLSSAGTEFDYAVRWPELA